MILRLQASFGADTAFPRDRAVITPHFQTAAVLTDADELCTDLATALRTWCGTTREVTVKAYDAQGTAPVFPIGSHTVDVGETPVSIVPREVACCLSFYSGQNVPRKRGRLYMPLFVLAAASAGLRPSSGQRTKIGDVATILADLGGVDVDWVVYSRANDSALPVSNWWVDDEWDTIRSRGLRATTRLQGTVSE